MQLYFIRHAQSENNALYARTGSWDGRHHDPGLSALGERQLPHLAAYLAYGNEAHTAAENDPGNRRGFGLTHLYCSLMERAIVTGRAIASTTGLLLRGLEDVHEKGGLFSFGEEDEERIGLPGPGRQELAARHPTLALPDGIAEDGWWNRPYEESDAFVQRAVRFLTLLLERHGDGDSRVAVVSHAGFYQAVMRSILGMTRAYPEAEGMADKPVWLQLNNTGISRIDFNADHLSVVYCNRLDHLPAELIT